MEIEQSEHTTDAADVIEEITDSVRRRRALRCASCRAEVTDLGARIEMDGAHRHTFVNPSGISFRIGCFGSAPGVRGLGELSRWWSWFPGFAWRVALCAGCRRHLGWSFHGEWTFWGLILDRLVEDDADARPET